jgi:hypothetical protein
LLRTIHKTKSRPYATARVPLDKGLSYRSILAMYATFPIQSLESEEGIVIVRPGSGPGSFPASSSYKALESDQLSLARATLEHSIAAFQF